MKFIVFGTYWAGGMKMSPIDIINKYCKSEPKLIPENGNIAPHYEIDISGEELIAMAASNNFDILISRGDEYRLLAFDAYGKMFRQR